ncbi:enoyl-CoA hydratase/isomerase family protein [Pseudonocardia spinosispora]|uniref:enoyl-CoA hydratase/isomerase family protein n=1 Tax=Pseudonocardia spinosispora TaxID=103441 RepID=UPI00048CE4CB|nr:enoyl-CoA hydratase/isomerase family protein [Pseudonocardia spinosispora]
MGPLRLAVDGPIATLTLNRPRRLNAFNREFLAELLEVCRRLDDELSVRVVVLIGEGRAFSAGFDLDEFIPRTDGPLTHRVVEQGRRALDAVDRLRPLTIAAVHGYCVGGGLVLAAVCDLRIASQDAVFSIPEVDLGIPLALGGIPRLVRELGPALTKELVLTCRPFGAQEAHTAGFLNRVVPPERLHDEVFELAETLAAKPAVLLEQTKRHIDATTEELASTAHGGTDAMALAAALADPEVRASASRYLAKFGRTHPPV